MGLKPHIRRVRPGEVVHVNPAEWLVAGKSLQVLMPWVCQGGGCAGFGATPAAAYGDWYRQVQKQQHLELRVNQPTVVDAIGKFVRRLRAS